MRVQELFKKVDAVEVADAYLVMHIIFYPYEHRTLREKIHAAGKLRQMIAESIQGFISCNAMIGDRQKTIFLFEEKENIHLREMSVILFPLSMMNRPAETWRPLPCRKKAERERGLRTMKLIWILWRKSQDISSRNYV